jgi:acylphosphatase
MSETTPQEQPAMPVPFQEVPQATASRGDSGDDVRRAHAYLKRFGYLPNTELGRAFTNWRPASAFDSEQDDEYDDNLEMAVTLFQRAYGLEETGEVDDATLELMSQPRCGFPDVATSEGLASFVAQGNRWPGPNVTYRHVNFTGDLSQAEVRSALRGAFDLWAAHIPLSFSEAATADIEIGFFAGNHGDGATNAFDGPSGTLAHCYYPPPNGGAIAGDCHFDEAETWSVNSPPSGIDLPTVALHELGHGLGLNHSNEKSAVMYAYYGGPRRELTADDIAGIQAVYGAKFRWASRGGAISMPVVGRNADGRLEVFVQGTDGALWHIWQTAPNNGWSGWHSLGGWITQPVVANNADGRLEVFVRGSDGALWHIWQTAPNGNWSGWHSLGGVMSMPTVGRNKDGRLEVFAQGTDGALWHIWQTAPNGNWSGWASLGGWITNPTVANNADGRLEVFVQGSDNALWHIWQTAPSNGWSGWHSLGGWIRNPAVGRNKDGRLEVFVQGSDNALWHIWQTAPNGSWSGWGGLGGWIRFPKVTNNADGRLEVFVAGSDTSLWHMWQTAPNNGWSGWSGLSGRMVGGPVVGQNQDGRLEVFVKGTDAALWHTWQSTPNGVWH